MAFCFPNPLSLFSAQWAMSMVLGGLIISMWSFQPQTRSNYSQKPWRGENPCISFLSVSSMTDRDLFGLCFHQLPGAICSCHLMTSPAPGLDACLLFVLIPASLVASSPNFPIATCTAQYESIPVDPGQDTSITRAGSSSAICKVKPPSSS